MNGTYFNSVMAVKTRRRRVECRDNTRSVFASFLMSLSAAVALQSALFPTGRRVVDHRQCYAPSHLAVLKDPDMLVKDDLFIRRDTTVGKKRKEKSLKSLEDAFFSSPDFDEQQPPSRAATTTSRVTPLVPLRSKPSSSSFVDRPKQLQQPQSILSVRQRKRSSPTQIQTTTATTTTMAMADGYQLGAYQNNINNNNIMEDVKSLMPAMTPFTTTQPPPLPAAVSASAPPGAETQPEIASESSITAQTAQTGVQFKTTRKRRRATMKVATAAPSSAAASSDVATGTSTGQTTSSSASSGTKPGLTMSKSSTMPGFANRGHTDKETAFRDGLRLAELRSGKNLGKALDLTAVRKNRRKLNGEAMYKNSASVPDSLVKFAHEIHDEDRITHWEEKELGVKTQEALRLQNLYDHLVAQLDREPTDEEWCAAAGKINMEAITQTIQEGIDAKNKLVTANLRMVQACVNLYIRNGLGGQYNAGDMMQEGIMALIRAAEKFEPERGFRFSTYAMYWIRSAVKRSQIFQSRVITVPHRLYENHKRVRRTQREMRMSMGRKPTNQELGDAVGMSAQQVERCLEAMAQRCYSLDQQVVNRNKPMSNNGGRGGESTMLDLVEGNRDDGEYKKQARTFLKEALIETMKRYLKEEEVVLLLLRYGLEDESDDSRLDVIAGPKTIAEVSDLVGLKPDKVRRMIDKSLKLLKVQIGNEWRDFERELQ